jgi:hypothetical protein
MRGVAVFGKTKCTALAWHRNLHRLVHSLVITPSELSGLECFVVCVDTAVAVARVRRVSGTSWRQPDCSSGKLQVLGFLERCGGSVHSYEL